MRFEDKLEVRAWLINNPMREVISRKWLTRYNPERFCFEDMYVPQGIWSDSLAPHCGPWKIKDTTHDPTR